MTESEGRDLFGSDGKGVYEALFPQPIKRVGDVSEAVADSTHQVAQEQPISAVEAVIRLEDAAAKAARENQDSKDGGGGERKNSGRIEYEKATVLQLLLFLLWISYNYKKVFILK